MAVIEFSGRRTQKEKKRKEKTQTKQNCKSYFKFTSEEERREEIETDETLVLQVSIEEKRGEEKKH